MGSARRQGANRRAGSLKKNIYVVLAVLAVSGAAGFIVPFYLSYTLYGVPWRRADDSVLIVRRDSNPQATPTWAKPSLPQVRVNFWVTSTSSLDAAVLDTPTATRTPTAVTIPTRPKNDPAPTATPPPPTRTKKPQDPTSTPRPPKPTKTQAPPRPPTNTPPPDTPAPAPTQPVPPTESTGAASLYAAATPTPHQVMAAGSGRASPSTLLQLQGSPAGALHQDFLGDWVGSFWSLIDQWWN